MLYPIETETRQLKDLSGIWEFKVDRKNEGYSKKWFSAPLDGTIRMPVPASYNDITQDNSIKEHIGDAWYERTFFSPGEWQGKKIVLRIGSASHFARVWINGIFATEHRGGFLPFEADISEKINPGAENRITVSVNNILDWSTLPPGELKEYRDRMHPAGHREQLYGFDFYNYSGIHRPPRLLILPQSHIKDITVKTDIRNTKGIVDCSVIAEGSYSGVRLTLFDGNNRKVASSKGSRGQLAVNNPRLWQPGKPYLYTLTAELSDKSGKVIDIYRLPVGIRTVKVQGSRFLINGKPFYFKGFSKHEDMDIKGKGLDEAILVKDFNLLKWINANSFRTAHYPYSEEILNLADREGIVVIDESPAVGMNNFDKPENIFVKGKIDGKTLETHINVMRDLVDRDKNHPCVVMWSVANEPASYEKGAGPYFRKVAAVTRKFDSTRPVTFVNCSGIKCRATKYFDVICINRYFGWYVDSGLLDVAEFQLEKELRLWHKRYNKPMIMTEFGADTIEGFHSSPPVMFTEEFQLEFIKCYLKVLDRVGFISGEHIWNFADFATKQSVNRVVGNRKGVFTRQRQPKMAAHFLKERWLEKK